MSSAYSSDFSQAPKDRMILINHPDWDCPAVMHYKDYPQDKGGPIYEYVEELISEVDFGITLPELVGEHKYQWTELPK